MPDSLESSQLLLLKRLHGSDIEHIVVGGWAVAAHGFVRVTKDLDIVPNPAAENLEKLAKMLQDLHATVLDAGDFNPEEVPADPTRAADLAMGGNFCLLTDIGRLDVMQWLSGVDFDDLYTELDHGTIESSIDGVPVRVCGLEHLRAMKRAAGRPQDLKDLEQLSGE
ncbi:MAG TPA: hypothetical protein VGL54_10605 [Solirubrobacteraceae bacterium]|jgi:hypothetical protein